MGKRYDEKTIKLFHKIHAEELRNNEDLKELLRNITVPNEIFSQESMPNPYFRFMSYVLGEDSEMKTYTMENLKKDLPKMHSITGRDHPRLNLILGEIERVALEKTFEKKAVTQALKEDFAKDDDDSKNSPTP